MKDVLAWLARVFSVSSLEAMTLRLTGAVLILLVTLLTTRYLKRSLQRRFHARSAADRTTLRFLNGSILVTGWLLGGLLALNALGVNLAHRRRCRAR